jgi:ribosomal protein L11 methyltransferase
MSLFSTLHEKINTMNHIEISIATNEESIQEILIALLENQGYEGFETNDTEVKAYISEELFNEPELQEIVQPFNLKFTQNIIQKQNWNAVWESNFDPVIVDDFVGVRAHFHQPIQHVQYEILITPKMSFGTGHHATTFTVMQLMRNINFSNKTVFDFGTGTAILAILAEKLGANNILAVDNDEWCIENSTENIQKNNCTNITIQLGNTAATTTKFDVVIANINKNIIQDNLALLNSAVATNGTILLSGLLIEDEKDILDAVKTFNWKHQKTITKGAWIAMYFTL